MEGTREFRDGRCNSEMVELLGVTDPDDVAELFQLIEEHVRYTGSDVARWVVGHWSEALPQFVKVLPHEYRLALERLAAERSEPSAQPVAA
jgi:glutamate synthase domain-containing protein 3